jgi:hypothetical protein
MIQRGLNAEIRPCVRHIVQKTPSPEPGTPSLLCSYDGDVSEGNGVSAGGEYSTRPADNHHSA